MIDGRNDDGWAVRVATIDPIHRSNATQLTSRRTTTICITVAGRADYERVRLLSQPRGFRGTSCLCKIGDWHTVGGAVGN